MIVRPTHATDIPALKVVLHGTQLFPSEMLPDMVAPFLSRDKSHDIWLTCEADGNAVGFCYARPEQMAPGTWNLLAIAVLPSQQGRGYGMALVEALEDTLRQHGHRILIVDTSGTDAFRQTRDFYCKRGYTEEARIRDFWAAGDDKVVFWKAL